MEKLLIAEYKPYSPHVGRITDESVEQFLDRINDVKPWMISIIVDERWGGTYRLLQRAVNYSYWPVMAKGLNVSFEMALKIGAEWVLTYDVQDAQLAEQYAIFEISPEKEEEIEKVDHVKRVLINNRNNHTGDVDKDFAKRVCEKIEDHHDTFVVVGSGYSSIEDSDVPERANAVLIGTELQAINMRQPQPNDNRRRPKGIDAIVFDGPEEAAEEPRY